MLASTLNIMWPMHMQSLKLQHQMVWEEMHLQEKYLIGPLISQEVALYPLQHVTYAHAQFKGAKSNGFQAPPPPPPKKKNHKNRVY